MEIKEQYQDKIIVLNYLFDEYKNEIKRSDSYFDDIRATRKTRLQSLRKEISNIMMDIEQNYHGGCYDNERVEQ